MVGIADTVGDSIVPRDTPNPDIGFADFHGIAPSRAVFTKQHIVSVEVWIGVINLDCGVEHQFSIWGDGKLGVAQIYCG